MDRVISSYTTTLRGLAHSRASRPEAAGRPALIVAVPDAPGLSPLPAAEKEASEISRLLSGARVLSGPDVTRDNVLAALPAHAIAHFACHGAAGLTDPGAGQIFLPDHQAHPLTVREIAALELDARLAYLSVCETSMGPVELADEAVHLTGTFHLAGYQHVIGTLWPVYDKAAQALAANVYRRLTRDGSQAPDTSRTAACLHHAVRELRSRYPHTPALWAAHTHTGP
jgi:CHAT domain-containing protein